MEDNLVVDKNLEVGYFEEDIDLVEDNLEVGIVLEMGNFEEDIVLVVDKDFVVHIVLVVDNPEEDKDLVVNKDLVVGNFVEDFVIEEDIGEDIVLEVDFAVFVI